MSIVTIDQAGVSGMVVVYNVVSDFRVAATLGCEFLWTMLFGASLVHATA